MSDDSTSRTSSASIIEQRAERQARHARLLRGALDRHDVSQAEVAVVAGVAPSKVARWCDPDSRDRPAWHEIEVLPDAVAVDVLRELARAHGFTLSQLPVGAKLSDDVAMLAATAKEDGEKLAAIAECIRPGKPPTREELLRVIKEGTESLETTAALVDRARGRIAEMDATPIRRGTAASGR